ncbi:GIY-YIG nuclease family protein [Alicyclobacillus mengziensis]|uniref:GIY-YIG nuclease family protein n=1 Tax=Alicyclobacillus mengziensis TaxID=2931921 RepID=A0A9X7W0B7_9BACL|nr:GIY-YIG nuclease family protein [Alicyclobacillus mengziensis]QSO48351.1 GIY-YIG nuclease family protein [Alicyclobacillus mengziensis]
MNIYVGNHLFEYVCDIVPDQVDGKMKAFLPQHEYDNHEGLVLHQYGMGPFCHFTIPKVNAEGVYVIQVSDQIVYVGECENLSNRFNMGNGYISPRNCYVGGQATNCRLNHHIYEMALVNIQIKLYFHDTHARFEVERELIEKLNPAWNIARGKYSTSVETVKVGRSITPKSPVVRSGSRRKSSCRDEVLLAAQSVVKRRGVNRFTVQEVVDFMVERKTPYQESTIRTHIVSKCCVNAPRHHVTTFNDFQRVDHGVYKLHWDEMESALSKREI